MSGSEWIALGSLSFFVVSALAGLGVGAVKLTWWLSAQFADLKETQVQTLRDHEVEDRRRHEENIERFGAIEVALNGRRHSRGASGRT